MLKKAQQLCIIQRVHNTVFSFKPVDYEPVVLFATVTRGYSPVVGAKVIANIEYPTGSAEKLEMRDDGAGADVEKGDGAYSAFIINSHVTGKHTISVEVESGNETAIKTVSSVGDLVSGMSQH